MTKKTEQNKIPTIDSVLPLYMLYLNLYCMCLSLYMSVHVSVVTQLHIYE